MSNLKINIDKFIKNKLLDNDINNINKSIIVPKSNENMEKFCLPKKYTLQPQQLLLPEILTSKYSPWNSDKNIRGILLYHQIGAGKTCTSITIAEKYKKKLKILVILPAALIGSYISELLSECTGNEYIKPKERIKLKKLNFDDEEYINLMDKFSKRISKYYTIYSYHKFIALINDNKIKNLNNTLLIIDEIQNMISINGTFYNSLNKIIDKSNESLKILLLSATPMFDKPLEIALTLNLLKRNDLFSINKFNQDYIQINKSLYNIINTNDFKKNIRGLISYYRGAPPQAYPTFKIKTVKCNMSKFQYKSYLSSLSSENNFIKGSYKNTDILNMPQNFFLGPRMVSNVSFPNKLTGEKGFTSFKGDKLLMKNIGIYSIKFYKIIQKINQSIGPIFVYSNFKEFGGIKCFVNFLEYHGWKNYKDYGIGHKHFAIWSGDEPHHLKEEIKSVFNKKENNTGELIKIILGSPSIKEGINLLRVEQVHIMEPYWNMSRMLQIMGRAIRFCSHKDVPKDRRFVDVFIYLSTYPNIKTIDKYIWSIVKKKNKLIEQFEKVLKESAIDCELFINRNSYPSDETKLKCNL
jgi:hypothetical protein